MASDGMEIVSVSAQAYTVPTEQPESDGTLEWTETTIVLVSVTTAEGHEGVGYVYGSASMVRLIADVLAPVLMGASGMEGLDLWTAMVRSVRNLGRPGLCSMAVSACDIALWDLRGKLLGVPVAALMGSGRTELPIYGSGGFTSYSDATHDNSSKAGGIRASTNSK